MKFTNFIVIYSLFSSSCSFNIIALANPNNLAKLVSIVRRQNGSYEVLDAEETAEFMKAIETTKGLSAVAIQVRKKLDSETH